MNTREIEDEELVITDELEATRKQNRRPVTPEPSKRLHVKLKDCGVELYDATCSDRPEVAICADLTFVGWAEITVPIKELKSWVNQYEKEYGAIK